MMEANNGDGGGVCWKEEGGCVTAEKGNGVGGTNTGRGECFFNEDV